MRKPLTWLALIVAAHISGDGLAQAPVSSEIAPAGKLRVGMNAANATLVTRTADGTVRGISVDLGKFIAGSLRLSYEPAVYASPETYTESFRKREWDIIVTGRNAFATTLVDFTPDVILIEYVFVAAPGREFADAGRPESSCCAPARLICTRRLLITRW